MTKTLKELKSELQTLTKRISKESLPSRETTDKNLALSIAKFNEVTKYLNEICLISDSESQEVEIRNCFSYCRKLIKKVLIRVNVRYEIPKRLGISIDTRKLVDEYSADDLTSESEGEMPNQTQSKFELGKFINGVVHQYDGSYAEMNSFLNQVAIIKETTETENVNFALQVIKSKINNMIVIEKIDFTTFDTLQNSLRKIISRPNTNAIENKILNFNQGALNSNQYKEIIEKATNDLIEAYVAEGKPHANAENDARKILIRSVSTNARNPMLRQAMEIGQFSNPNQVFEKILELQEHVQQVLYVRKANFRGKNYFNNDRGRTQNRYPNYRGGRRNNFNNNNRNRGPYRHRYKRGQRHERSINHVSTQNDNNPKNHETPGSSGDYSSQQ